MSDATNHPHTKLLANYNFDLILVILLQLLRFMFTTLPRCIVALLLCAITSHLHAQFEYEFPLSEIDRQIKLQKTLKAYDWLGRFTGVAILMKDEEIIYKYVTGYANYDYRVPSSLRERFNTCNITEAFTAIAIMQLVEKGNLNLTDTIGDYLSYLPPHIGDSITIHQLLTHTAGLTSYYGLPKYKEDFWEIETIDHLIQLIADQPLDHAPGTKFHHSSSNYVLLGAIIEQLSSGTYQDYVKQNILIPAKLNHTGLYAWDDTLFNKAISYTVHRKNRLKVSADYWGAFPFGADAIYATAEDILKFVNAFQDTLLLSEKSKQQMLAPHVYANSADNDRSYGYGWYVKNVDGKQVLSQGGNLASISAELLSFKDSGYSMVVLSNHHTNRASDIVKKLEEIIVNDNIVMPSDPLAFFLYEKMQEKGMDYVTENIDSILADNGYELERASTLNNLGEELMKVGDFTTALQVFQLNEKQFATDPLVYTSLGICHTKMGDPELADFYFNLKKFAENEIPNTPENLVSVNTELKRAAMFNKIAVGQTAKNELSKAERTYQDALKIRKNLAQNQPDVFLPDVAGTLKNLAEVQQAKNELGKAEQAFNEALDIYRKLAEVNPQAFKPDVAATLDNIAVLQKARNEYGKATQAYSEALQIYRELATDNPKAYLPDVALTLNNFADLHIDNNEIGKAKIAYNEALDIYTKLAQVRPYHFLPHIAVIRTNIANVLRSQNDMAAAELEYQAVIKIYRKLALKNPDLYLPDLATMLNNLASFYHDQKDLEKVELSYLEALQIREKLAFKFPEVYLPYLAMTKTNLSIFYLQDRPNEEKSIQLAIETLIELQAVKEIPFIPKYNMAARQILEAWGYTNGDVEAMLKE